MIETMSRCSHCGKENPAPYRFCGSCGKPIEASRSLSAALMEAQPPAPPKQTSAPTTSKAESPRKEEPSFGGPSFLGLNGDRSGAEYLLEDEESSSGHGRRMVLALVILLLAGALLGWRFYFGAFPWQARSTAPANNNVTAQTNAPSQDGQAAAGNSSNANSPANSVNPVSNDAQSAAAQTPGTAVSNAATPQEAAKPADPNATQTSSATGATSGETDATQQGAAPNAADADKAAGSENTQAAPEPAKKTAQLKETAPVSKSTTRKVAMREEDSQESEAAALLTQGERYLYGNGVEQNCGRAQDSIRAAADHASVQALTDLGTMYSTGHCVRKDLPTAYRWYVKALHQQPSNTRISSDLQALWNQMTPQEKQTAMQSR